MRPSKNLRWPVKFVLIAFIVLCCVFTTGLTALNFYPGLTIVPFAVHVPKSPYCTVWKGVTDVSVKLTQAQMEKKILAESHPLRTDGGYKLWSTPEGEFWVPDTSDEILSILLAQQRRKIYGDSNTGGVKEGDIVLDGGAHIGTYVMTALRAGASKIIAIEPSPEALECLRRNFRKEIESGRVVVYPKGIWDEEKTLVFFATTTALQATAFSKNRRGRAGSPTFR